MGSPAKATLLRDFELAPVDLCYSRDRIIQRCNTSFAAMFGYDSAEF